jgi:hypothetical protein
LTRCGLRRCCDGVEHGGDFLRLADGEIVDIPVWFLC